MPTTTAERARAVAAGQLPVVRARPGATVLLLRDAAGGDATFEVYIHHRHSGMKFAARMVAFPGGGVDSADYEGDEDSAGHERNGLPAWVRSLATDKRTARAFVAGAIRETHEETGVALTADQLVPWAHWVTPRFSERRYDTWFFLARLPGGQQPTDVSGEAERVEWIAPAAALERLKRGDLSMMPPTQTVLAELATFPSLDAVFAAGNGRVIETTTPAWVDLGDRVGMLFPGDDGYPGDDPGEG